MYGYSDSNRPMMVQDAAGPRARIKPPVTDGVTGGMQLQPPEQIQPPQPAQPQPTTAVGAADDIVKRAAPAPSAPAGAPSSGGAPSREATPAPMPSVVPGPIPFSPVVTQAAPAAAPAGPQDIAAGDWGPDYSASYGGVGGDTVAHFQNITGRAPLPNELAKYKALASRSSWADVDKQISQAYPQAPKAEAPPASPPGVVAQPQIKPITTYAPPGEPAAPMPSAVPGPIPFSPVVTRSADEQPAPAPSAAAPPPAQPAPVPFGPPSGNPQNTISLDPMELRGKPLDATPFDYERWKAANPPMVGPGGSSAPGAPGVNTAPITGNETPYAINPGQSGDTNALMQKIQEQVLRGMQEPTAFDDSLYTRARDTAYGDIDKNAAASEQRLNSEMARRGLSYSSTAGAGYENLNSDLARQKDTIDTTLLRERAQALASGRQSALNTASQFLGARTGLEAGNRAEARGERSYTDTLRANAQADAERQFQMQEALRTGRLDEYQQLVQQGLNYGQNGAVAGAGMVGSASGTAQNIGGQYGYEEGQANDQLGELARLAAQLFGGNPYGGQPRYAGAQ